MTQPTTSTLPFLKSNSWEIVLSKIPSYDEFNETFYERLDYPLLKLLSENENIKIQSRNVLQNCILNHINKDTSIMEVKHRQPNGLGRFYGNKQDDIFTDNNGSSIIPLTRKIKHTLFHYLGWTDIDMVKGHPTIAVEMGKLIGLSLPAMEDYIVKFDEYCDKLIPFYSNPEDTPLHKDDIKLLFNLKIYGGSFNRWVNDMTTDDHTKGRVGITLQNTEVEHPLFVAFGKDCKTIQNAIYKSNSPLVRKLRKKDDTDYETKNRITSYWFQVIENHILYLTYRVLVSKNIIKHKWCALEYDGICFPPTTAEYDKDETIATINDMILNQTGLCVKFKFKSYPIENIQFGSIENRNDIPYTAKEVDMEDFEGDEFTRMCKEFEKTHAKIVEGGVYIEEQEDEVIVRAKPQIIASYEHLSFEDKKGNKKIFIENWIRGYDGIRKYERMNTYPNPSLCPPDCFNLWIPFAMESVKDYVVKNDELDFIIHHIKILCNHEIPVYDYFIKWLAFLIQKPEKKSTCPTLISSQGAGKGSLLKLLGEMLGRKKVFETTEPARDVWGNFNGLMKDAYLVNLNEMSKKDTVEAENKIKGLITEPTLTINCKGKDSYTITSYHKFLGTTNNPDPMRTSADDRRNMMIRSSDELCRVDGDIEGNKRRAKYFDDLHRYLNDVNVIKTCYEYFKGGVDLSDFKPENMPLTEYQNNLKELAISPVEHFIKTYIMGVRTERGAKISCSELYSRFVDWKHCNGYEDTHKMNAISFGVKLANMKIGGFNKTKLYWEINVPVAVKFLKV